MKKFIILSLVFCLTLLSAGSTLAAVHNSIGDCWSPNLLPDLSNHSCRYFSKYFSEAAMPNFEGWYYIEKDAPGVTARGSLGSGVAFAAEYFQNDQTFADFYFYDPDTSGSYLYLKGSYLFENDFFVGVDYGDSQLTFAPGYRLDLDDNCYVAASLDYAVNHQYSTSDSPNGYQGSGLVDVEFNGRYYTTDSRVYGQFIIPNGDVAGIDDLFLLGGGAYQYTDNIVLGANLISWGDYTYYEFGCTAAFEQIEAEFRYLNNDDADEIDCNVIYPFTDQIRAGLELKDVFDNPYIILKGKYTVDTQNAAVLMYQFQNGDDDGALYLRWDIAF
jgi:hypothetical protein